LLPRFGPGQGVPHRVIVFGRVGGEGQGVEGDGRPIREVQGWVYVLGQVPEGRAHKDANEAGVERKGYVLREEAGRTTLGLEVPGD